MAYFEPTNLSEQLDILEHNITQAQEQMEQLGDFKYLFNKFQEYRKGLFETCPIQVGDKVELTYVPEITAEVRPGWYVYRNLLKKGRRAIVQNIEYYYRSGFVADIEFIHLGIGHEDMAALYGICQVFVRHAKRIDAGIFGTVSGNDIFC